MNLKVTARERKRRRLYLFSTTSRPKDQVRPEVQIRIAYAGRAHREVIHSLKE